MIFFSDVMISYIENPKDIKSTEKTQWNFYTFAKKAKLEKTIPIYCIIKDNEVPGNNLQWKIYTLQPENYETLVMEGGDDPSRWKDIRVPYLEDFMLLA